jgi:hypothetical protein
VDGVKLVSAVRLAGRTTTDGLRSLAPQDVTMSPSLRLHTAHTPAHPSAERSAHPSAHLSAGLPGLGETGATGNRAERPGAWHAVSRRAWLLAGLASALPAWAEGFDHSHAAWTALLRKHVVLLRQGQASQVRYAGMAGDRAALKAYRDSLAAVGADALAGFSQAQQMAFLINAYNANTVELILTRYPKLESIKDLGTLFSNPWKPKWIPLLGDTLSLDDIEHGRLRARGRYDDPRVHFAVNCASVGCPMLREEAFVADRLDAQLDDQARRFLSDRTRNRGVGGKLEVSKIFDWYGEDFRLGHRGIGSLKAFLARYAEVLADSPADRERIRAEQSAVSFLDYDWKLNDAR